MAAELEPDVQPTPPADVDPPVSVASVDHDDSAPRATTPLQGPPPPADVASPAETTPDDVATGDTAGDMTLAVLDTHDDVFGGMGFAANAATADPTSEVSPVSDEPSTRPVWFRRRAILVVASSVVVVLAIATACVVAMAVTPTSAGSQATPTPTASYPQPVDGWSGEPVWEAHATEGSIAVTGDGRGVLTVTKTGDVEMLDAESGTRFSSWASDGDVSVRAARIDGMSGAVASTPTSVAVWQYAAADPVVTPIPDGSRVTVRPDGTALVVMPDQSNASVSVITATGLLPFTSPIPGASPLTLTTAGTMLWASARGLVIDASQPGTAVSTITPAPPAPGATITSWTGVLGTQLYLKWTLPDASTVLVGHSLTDGSAIASAPISDTASKIVTNQTLTRAMVGNAGIDVDEATITVLDFTATVGLGEGFYGAVGTDPAFLQGPWSTTLLDPPIVSPLALTHDGKLLALTGDTITAYERSSKPAADK